MRRIANYGGPLLATCLALSGLTSAFADTTTTTVTTKTTTVDGQPSFVLPASSYVIVDPLTGTIRGDYVTGARVIDGTPLTSNFIVMDKISRRVVGTFDANGNLVDFAAAPATSNIVVSVNSHRRALLNEIDTLFAQGRLTTAQADAMRLDINRLFPGEDVTTTTRTVTYNNALAQDSALYSVESRLLPLQQKTYTSKVVSPRFVTINGQLVLPDNVTYRRLQLDRRMEDEFAFGHLTKDQLIQLKSDMTEIANKDAALRSNGVLSDANNAIVAADLNALQAKMEQYVASVDAGVRIGAK